MTVPSMGSSGSGPSGAGDQQSTSVDFSDLAGVDLIRLTDNVNRESARITDQATIAAVAAWLTQRTDGWTQPLGGARIMPDRLNFSVEGRPKGNVGIGKHYLTAHRRGHFYQRDSTPADRSELFGLLGFVGPED